MSFMTCIFFIWFSYNTYKVILEMWEFTVVGQYLPFLKS